MVDNEIRENHEYPFKSRYLELSNGHRMHYIDEGSGEPLVLVHGNPTWSFYYREIIKAFSPQYRVIALDHVGSGLSSKPKNYSYRLQDHTNNLTELIEHLRLEKLHLLMHDWGGAIGMSWATEHLRKVSSVVLFNTAAFLSQDIPKRIGVLRTPVVGSFLIRGFNVFAQAACHMAVAKPLKPSVRSGLLYPYKTYSSRIGIDRFVQDIPLKPSHPSYQRLQRTEQRLTQLNCPKLILWGMQDFCFHKRFLQRWEEIYPDAKVVRFEDGGHYLLEDKTEEVLSHLRSFLPRNS